MKKTANGSFRLKGARNLLLFCIFLVGVPAVSYVSGITVHGLIAVAALIGLGMTGLARFSGGLRHHMWLAGVSFGLVAGCVVTGFIALAGGDFVPRPHILAGMFAAGMFALIFFAYFKKKIHICLAAMAIIIWCLLVLGGFLRHG